MCTNKANEKLVSIYTDKIVSFLSGTHSNVERTFKKKRERFKHYYV